MDRREAILAMGGFLVAGTVAINEPTDKARKVFAWAVIWKDPLYWKGELPNMERYGWEFFYTSCIHDDGREAFKPRKVTALEAATHLANQCKKWFRTVSIQPFYDCDSIIKVTREGMGSSCRCWSNEKRYSQRTYRM